MAEASVAGRVAIVSGAGGGLGRAMTLALVEAGARVAAVDANRDLAERIAGDARAAAGEDCVVPICRDLREPDGCAAAVDETLSAFGSVHAVVNNAGIGMATIRENFWADNVKFWDVPTDKWEAVFDVNVKAPFMLAKAAVPYMIAGGWGRIVNVTTSLDTMIRPAWTPYGPSKAALEASSANWAGDLDGTGVTVNVLIPGGPADTPFVTLASQPDRSRLIQPGKMAPPILWLLSDASDGVNGRRFVANDWNPDIAADQAAEAASAPIAWKGFGRQAASQPVPGSARSGETNQGGKAR